MLVEIFTNTNHNFEKSKILLSIFFSGDKEMKRLNSHYRNINNSTNILSFPVLKENNNSIKNFLGDIIFSSETIHKEAKQEKKHIYNHLVHLFVHGILHLLGYDHENEENAIVMENLEIKILKKLCIENPYI